MNLLIKITAPVAVAVTAATALALAAPVAASADVYPAVPANPDVCEAERIEIQIKQAELDTARTELDTTRRLFRTGAASYLQLLRDQRAVAQAMIALNTARYAEGDCRNKAGRDPNKACVTLALELNRLIDELPIRSGLERIAAADYQSAIRAGSAVSREVLNRLRLAANTAKLLREQTEAKIVAQRRLIANTPACRDFPAERPEVLPPPREETSTTTPPQTSPTSTVAPPTTIPARTPGS